MEGEPRTESWLQIKYGPQVWASSMDLTFSYQESSLPLPSPDIDDHVRGQAATTVGCPGGPAAGGPGDRQGRHGRFRDRGVPGANHARV